MGFLNQKNKVVLNYLTSVAGIMCILFCFFFNYVKAESVVVGIECNFDFTAKLICKKDNMTYSTPFDCKGDTFCNILKVTPYLAGMIIFFACCTLIMRLTHSVIAKKINGDYITYGMMTLDFFCLFLAFLTPTMMLSKIEVGLSSHFMPVAL